MIYFHDAELKGHVLIFKGPLDLIKAAKEGVKRPGVPQPYKEEPKVNFPGRIGKSWDDLERFLHSVWNEAVTRVQYVQAKVKSEPMPTPKSIRRKGKWNEVEGDIDVDRALHGDPEFYNRKVREKITGPTNICLVCNLDDVRYINPSGLFYRSTAAIAVTDILEELGYQVEIVAWCRGEQVFPQPDHNQFTVCRIKEAGQTVDITALCDTMSGWFSAEAVFCANCACPTIPVRLGIPKEANEHAKTVKGCGVGPWIKYLDIAENTLAIPVPMVWGSLDNAVDTAKEVLTNIIESQG